jgi:ArsR family transcriptional regulator, lead/cadmium/zinc/bismuth-responsive transcriptional repressor
MTVQVSKQEAIPDCGDDHAAPDREPIDAEVVRRAASLLKAMADEGRLHVLALLAHGETCVSELSMALGTDISTVSHRLRVLRSAGLVQRRRAGRHVYYHLEDDHVRHLLEAALEHAAHGNDSGRR